MPNHLKLTALGSYTAKKLPLTKEPAAVMILLLELPGQHFEVVLTKRSVNLPTYSGHYSFPGGMHDKEDENLLATATRELKEELNIPPGSYELLGEIDDFTTHDGQLVRPFVAKMHKNVFTEIYNIQNDEIESIYYLPLNKLQEFKDNPLLHSITVRRPSYSFIDENVFVWGLTASILVHLESLLK